METAALVPVKSFVAAKARLSSSLSVEEREHLARGLATGVVRALEPLPVFVACDDDLVAGWAEGLGAEVVWGPGLGLNDAVDDGIDRLAGKGFDHVVVAHGDLPRPESLPSIATADTVVLVPDRRNDGTNVLARPTSITLAASYGPGSFHRHLTAALGLGARVQVRRDPLLALDIDTADDVRHPTAASTLTSILAAEAGR